MSENWEFIEQDEDKMCWWKLPFPDDVSFDEAQAECLCIWPEIKEDGSIRFGLGTTYDDGYGYFEFEYCGSKKTLEEAKISAEKLLEKLPRTQ